MGVHHVMNPDPYQGLWGTVGCRDCPVLPQGGSLNFDVKKNLPSIYAINMQYFCYNTLRLSTSHSNFLISISLKPEAKVLRYCKL